MKAVRSFSVLALALCLILASLYGQASNATIKGTIIDPTGAVITQASVELINSGTGESRRTQTGAQGTYTFTAVPPGEYELKTTAPGFAEWAGRLTLRVAQEAVVDVNLTTASLKTSVQVIADVTPVLNPESSSLSDIKEVARIESLPMQSRNFLNIPELHSGRGLERLRRTGPGIHPRERNSRRVDRLPGGRHDRVRALHQ